MGDGGTIDFDTWLRRRLRRVTTERRAIGRASGATTVHDHLGDEDVWRAVRALPDRQRVAVVLRYVPPLGPAVWARRRSPWSFPPTSTTR